MDPAAPHPQSDITWPSPGRTSTLGTVGCGTLSCGGVGVFYRHTLNVHVTVLITVVLRPGCFCCWWGSIWLSALWFAATLALFVSMLLCPHFNDYIRENGHLDVSQWHPLHKCVPFHPTHTHVHACASTHTQTRLTKPPTFTPPVESRKCGSVKVTGYLGWLWFPNCLSISRLQFHRCGCPHSLTCCLISESQPPHLTDRPRTSTTMKPIK